MCPPEALVRKLAHESGNRCQIVGLTWLSACLEGKSRVDPKAYVLFDPSSAPTKKKSSNSSSDNGAGPSEGGGGGTSSHGGARYRLVDVNKFACAQASDHAAARNHNKV
jgi:hypothetical protein